MKLTQKEIEELIDSCNDTVKELDRQVEQHRRIQARIPVTLADFISNKFDIDELKKSEPDFITSVEKWCEALNTLREKYIETDNYKYWRLFWDLVPINYIYPPHNDN